MNVYGYKYISLLQEGSFMKIDKKKLLVRIALPLIVGAISSLLTRGSMEAFEALNQPPLSPPGWLFPVVWTILYTLMGISAYIIDMSDIAEIDKQKIMRLYHLQLTVNFLWPIFFFSFQWYLFSFFWLLLLIVLVVLMIKEFYKISNVAAFINIPYLIWLVFAAYLNIGVWWLNR